MSDLFTEVQTKAARLSDTQRAELALRLIESLEPADAKDWEAAWLAECEARWARHERGLDAAVPLEAALAKARAGLR